MSEEKPLHVRVAEALGSKPVDAAWGYIAPPEEGVWSHLRSRLLRSRTEASAAYEARGFKSPGDEEGVCWWKDGWGPLFIEEYDTDWAATGPLIESMTIALGWSGDSVPGQQRWAAVPSGGAIYGRGPTTLIAVCNLILALKEAGKL